MRGFEVAGVVRPQLFNTSGERPVKTTLRERFPLLARSASKGSALAPLLAQRADCSLVDWSHSRASGERVTRFCPLPFCKQLSLGLFHFCSFAVGDLGPFELE